MMPESKEKAISQLTACTMDCPDACSLVVTRADDGSVKVKGNPGIYPPAETVANAFALTAHSPDFEETLTRTWTRIKTGQ